MKLKVKNSSGLTRIGEGKGSKVFDVFNVILMFLFLLVTLYPFWYAIIISLSDGKAVMANRVSGSAVAAISRQISPAHSIQHLNGRPLLPRELSPRVCLV